LTAWRIIGIGSRMSRDDAIGLRLVSALAREAGFRDRCTLLEDADMATVTLDLMDRGGPVVLVDAADMGLPPGAYRFFDDRAAKLTLRADSVSTHGLGLADSLGIARALGFSAPAKIFAAQPFDLSPAFGLSDAMNHRFSTLLDALRIAVSSTASAPPRPSCAQER
jgi:hydrogenase maturation protease